MKSIQMKRVEAQIRLENSTYTDSKAKRNGISKEQWEKNKARDLVHMDRLTGGSD